MARVNSVVLGLGALCFVGTSSYNFVTQNQPGTPRGVAISLMEGAADTAGAAAGNMLLGTLGAVAGVVIVQEALLKELNLNRPAALSQCSTRTATP